MTRVRIALFKNLETAEPVQQRLLKAGIPVEIHPEPAFAKLWFVSNHRGGIRLEVPAGLVEDCSKLIAKWDADGVLFTPIRCPECRSLRVDYPQFTEKSLLTNLVMGLLAEVRLLPREYYCEDCHNMWPKEGTCSRRFRRHLAPTYFIEGVESAASPVAKSRTGRA